MTLVRILAIFASCSLAPAFAGCATTRGAAKVCAVDMSIINEVGAALARDDWAKQLEALAARYTLCVLNRDVEAVITPSGAKVDPVVLEHGRAWLAAHGGP
jgi:hypothetical protein